MTESDEAVTAAYREQKRRVLATLIRLLGSFDAAEEALHEAFAAATVQWRRDGIPKNPYAWLVSTGRFRMVDRWRRQARLAAALPDLAALADTEAAPGEVDAIGDDELRLIFTCCHPALPADARVALTLREVAGLTTEEIARAYLSRASTVAQRIVRAKAKIRDEAIPYVVPGRAELPARLGSVLHVVYLIYNEAHLATSGPDPTRPDLGREAVRLGRLIVGLVDDSEAQGLLALMLLHEARARARTGPGGDLVLLEDQDRGLWDRAAIEEACGLIEAAFASRRIGSYVLQAAIAAQHATAARFEDTDWGQIVALYDVLLRVDGTPVVALNRGVAVSMRDGPEAGLAAVEALLAAGHLDEYHPAHVARGEMLRRLGRAEEARAAYGRALALTGLPAERRALERRMAALRDLRDTRLVKR